MGSRHLLLLTSLIGGTAAAATVCPAPDTCDFTTIGDCAAHLPADDDTCWVEPGVYREQVGIVGTLSRADLVFECTSPRGCVVDGDHVRAHGFVTNGWTLRGFEIRHTTSHAIRGITESHRHQPREVSDCTIHDIGGAGIWRVGQDGVAQRNEIRNTWLTAIQCALDKGSFQTVKNNLVVDAGLQGAVPAISCNVEGSLVAHNTVEILDRTPPDATAPVPYGILARDARHNIVVGGHVGLFFSERAEGNLLWGFTTTALGSNPPELVAAWEDENLVADPRFFGPDDHYLQSHSPARDLGDPSEAGEPDLSGAPRDDAPDVGAIEHDPDHVLQTAAWGFREIVADPGERVGPATAWLPDHGPALAWIERLGGAVVFAARSEDGTWRREEIRTGYFFTSVPHVAVSHIDLHVDPATGQPVVVWAESLGGQSVVRVARRQPDGCSTECASPHWYGCADAPIFVAPSGDLDLSLRFDPVSELAGVGILHRVGSCNSQSGNTTLHYRQQRPDGAWEAPDAPIAAAACDGSPGGAFIPDFAFAFDPWGAPTFAYTLADGDGSQPANHGPSDVYFVEAVDDAPLVFTTEMVPLGEGVRGDRGNRTFVALAHALVDSRLHSGIALPALLPTGQRVVLFAERAAPEIGWGDAVSVVADKYGGSQGFVDGVALTYLEDGLPAVVASLGTMLVATEPSGRSDDGLLPYWTSEVLDAQRTNGLWPGLVAFDAIELLVGHQQEAPNHRLKVAATADPGGFDPTFVGPEDCDACPDDPNKTDPGRCGCGNPEPDEGCGCDQPTAPCEGNAPPEITPPGDQTTVLWSAVDLPIVASDPDDDDLTFSAVGLPPGLAIDVTTGRIVGAPWATGSFAVTVRVSDGVSLVEATLGWSVTNTPPSLTSPGDRVDHVGDAVTFTLVATDADGHALAHGADGLPPGVEVDATTGEVHGSPLQRGTFDVTWWVTDGAARAEHPTTWEVPNRPPIIENVEVLETLSSHLFGYVTSFVDGWDPDGDRVTFGADGLPPGVEIDTEWGDLFGIIEERGAFEVTFWVFDGDEHTELDVTWEVLNRPPYFHHAIADRFAWVGDLFSVAFFADDEDLDPLTFEVDGDPILPGSLAVDPEAMTLEGPIERKGTFTIQVTAADGHGGAESTSFVLTVPNRAPTLDEPEEQEDHVGDAVDFTLVASDPDGDPLVFTATDLPPGVTLHEDGRVDGAPSRRGSYLPVVTVTDDDDATDTRSFWWQVPARAPVLDAIEVPESYLGDTIALWLTATSPDGEPLTFVAYGLPTGLSMSEDGLVSGTISAKGSSLVTFTVSDPDGYSDGALVPWPVPNRAPTVAPIADRATCLDDEVALDIDATEPDGDTLTLWVDNLPPGLVFADGRVTGAPTQAGAWPVNVNATDGDDVTTVSFTWTTEDCSDACPDDPTKTAPGLCGCGVPDVDSDSDDVPDCLDDCPDDPDRFVAGDEGCDDPGEPNDTGSPVDTGRPDDTGGQDDTGGPDDTGDPPFDDTGSVSPGDDDDPTSCGCSASGTTAAWWSPLVLLLAIRRRRAAPSGASAERSAGRAPALHTGHRRPLSLSSGCCSEETP